LFGGLGASACLERNKTHWLQKAMKSQKYINNVTTTILRLLFGQLFGLTEAVLPFLLVTFNRDPS